MGKVVAMQHRWLINMKKIMVEHIENLQKLRHLSQDWMFHEMLPFKYVSAFELNLCCTCTVSTDNGCRFIHLWWKKFRLWWSSPFPEMHCILSVGRGPQKPHFCSTLGTLCSRKQIFPFNSRYFGLQLSKFWHVLIYDIHFFYTNCSHPIPNYAVIQFCRIVQKTWLSCNANHFWVKIILTNDHVTTLLQGKIKS